MIDADIDGQNSSSFKIDRETPHLGALHASRRVARTIFVGATPNVGAANQGLEVRRIRLGATFAGDKPGPISDALNRLAATAPHLYVDRDEAVRNRFKKTAQRPEVAPAQVFVDAVGRVAGGQQRIGQALGGTPIDRPSLIELEGESGQGSCNDQAWRDHGQPAPR